MHKIRAGVLLQGCHTIELRYSADTQGASFLPHRMSAVHQDVALMMLPGNTWWCDDIPDTA